jgi:hypothetical protein
LLVARNASTLELDLEYNEMTLVGVRTLLDDNVGAVKTLSKHSLGCNRIGNEGATILANALGRDTMPNLKRLDLSWCGVGDDGFAALVSALEQNTSLRMLVLRGNDFGERGYVALAESLPNIKGLQEINITQNTSFRSTTLPLSMEGFRKNCSLVKVTFGPFDAPVVILQEMKSLGRRNRITLLLNASPPLGIWSRALAKVAKSPDVLFHAIRNKPKQLGWVRGRDDE